jgi:hypothetical protein
MQPQPTNLPPQQHHLTFRNSRIIYYGPHECGNCGVLICKMGYEFGGNAFTYPSGPIYPNTEWHPHVCDPRMVAAKPKPTIGEIGLGPELRC